MAPSDQRRPRARRAGPRWRLRVAVVDARGRPVSAGGLGRWLAGAAPRSASGSVTVALVSDVYVRALNRTYRGTDRATDVLSFPAEDLSPQKTQRTQRTQRTRRTRRTRTPKDSRPAKSSVSFVFSGANRSSYLGDIAIARGVARRQARAARHPEQTELRVLALHGLLHLLGYDHEADGGEMARVERRLRHRAGLEHGLIERITAHAPAGPARHRR